MLSWDERRDVSARMGAPASIGANTYWLLSEAAMMTYPRAALRPLQPMMGQSIRLRHHRAWMVGWPIPIPMESVRRGLTTNRG